jgi:OmcA/MtrC family decaheme c-type cytochrome
LAFAVTDPSPRARRVIVDDARCDRCHAELTAHGGARRGVEACALCHNPSASNLTGTARLEGATIAVPSVELGFLIHRLHTGDALSAPFVLGASPGPTSSNPSGRPYDARRVRYPGVRGDCATCHLDGTWVVPDAGDRLPSRLETRACVEAPADDADALCAEERWVSASSTVYAPTTRACLGCHDARAVEAHAAVNTTPSGAEACAVCHGPGAEQDVARVHPIR